MLPTTSLQLKALLAMPTALRPVLLLGAFAPSRSPWPWVQHRCLSASSCYHGQVKYPNVGALVIPEFRTSSIAEIAPDDLFKTSSLSSAPGQPLDEELTKLYTKTPAAFVYAESDFYKLKKNTRVSEVCILGRSNVGKSSLVNALAHRPNNGLAFVSTKAGKTRSINMYGFGPAPTIKELQAQGSKYKDEPIPTHTFYLVDMPGYGHASQKEWGKNISLYLNKRSAVKGAIVLIDAEVGPKDSDLHLLELLSAAQLKTAIVLTKADKVKKGLEGLRETCKKVWDALHNIEMRTTEGNWAWERDVYVTAVGARDSNVVKSTVAIARLAVARLAGLVKDERPDVAKNKRWSGKMISFDDLQYIPSKSEVRETNASTPEPTQATRDIPSSSKNRLGLSQARTAFEDLERAAKAQHAGRTRISAGRRSRNWTGAGTGRAHARAFYSTSVRNDEESQNKLTKAERDAAIDEFLKSLKANSERDRVRRIQLERQTNPPRVFKRSFEAMEKREARRLVKQFPEIAARTKAVLDRRLAIGERQRQNRATSEAEPRAIQEDQWPTTTDANNHRDVNQAMDADEFESAFAKSKGLKDNEEKQRTNKKKAL
ncbi:hypothetical protein ONZ43_g4945 [Nemania bipapillata]|uniref:Uncharacterized protein n=1 Tax=Nemania bipapillata TaxID=110536 RepID=A0ACC2IGH1_9PEZI|nr:hypothetical protein ONZ43_g4945 [Nemania bipapillata]